MKTTDFAVIFDMDGVIFDSERAYIDSFRVICEEEGIPFIEQACIDCIGANWNRSKVIFEEAYGEDFDFPHYYDLVRKRLGTLKFDLKPGVHEIFEFLEERDIPIALASSTSKNSVMRMLSEEGMLTTFDVIVCGDMVTHSKPHPEIFLTAAEKLGVAPENCYVIEDSFNGIRCAHNAGMHPVMVPDILQPDDEIRGLAQVVLPSLNEAIEFLGNCYEASNESTPTTF